ncbi:DUF1254 domain-containing protein [Novosphingobium sp.]|uniref:DUF1254 domain-containing protein n=1 Tax=Novosphingobium sp. TaxID=1874826 RepID=UPI00286A5ACA|nr:DUF1254 domain-containing protein [Novosphingobium sp.]
MNRTLKLLALFGAAAAVGHVGLVLATPHVLMRAAMNKLGGPDKAVNAFLFGPRTTQNSRGVVRPSPDLAYSTCVYDLSNGPVRISAAPSPDEGYVSLSVFAANTDNIAVFDTTRQPQGIVFVLAREAQKTPPGVTVVISPSDRGIVLDRRLAPNAERFAAADAARSADRCAPL